MVNPPVLGARWTLYPPPPRDSSRLASAWYGDDSDSRMESSCTLACTSEEMPGLATYLRCGEVRYLRPMYHRVE